MSWKLLTRNFFVLSDEKYNVGGFIVLVKTSKWPEFICKLFNFGLYWVGTINPGTNVLPLRKSMEDAMKDAENTYLAHTWADQLRYERLNN